jgi:hypothetical protein
MADTRDEWKRDEDGDEDGEEELDEKVCHLL